MDGQRNVTQKVITGREAAALIQDQSTVALSGFIGFGLAEEVLCALESRFLDSGHPKGINLVSVAGLGGDGKSRGFNHFGHPGMVGRLYASNLSMAGKLSALIADNLVPAYLLPQGVLAQMFRAIAGGKPGVISTVGLRTFVDPRVEGAKMNEAARRSGEEVVELLKLGGKECLFYPAFSVDVAVIKGNTADKNGNISCEREALRLEQFEMAAAAKNSGGMVIAQVEKIRSDQEIHPKQVVVPGHLVDYLVIATGENARQQFALEKPYEPSWAGEERIALEEIEPMAAGVRKVIAKRVAKEIRAGDFLNLGIGIPDGVSRVLNEAGNVHTVTMSVESGVIGGVPAPGLGTGAAYNPQVILRQTDMFDYYDGGGIDFACLGGAQFDQYGNVNSSKFNGKVTGPGGFINISQNAKRICFAATFTAGHAKMEIQDGKLHIIKEGSVQKFCKNVEQITFSGRYSAEQGRQKVMIVTERAVFELTRQGLLLKEIAPGIDLQRDVLGQMEFSPSFAPDLKLMSKDIFC